MLKIAPLALELLEYKVGDMLAKRSRKENVTSAWALHDFIQRQKMTLSEGEKHRFDEVARQLRQFEEKPFVSEKKTVDFEKLELFGDMVVDDASAGESLIVEAQAEPEVLTPAELEEQAVLMRLARLMWWADTEKAIARLATRLRAERERRTARLLYALVRNFALHKDQGKFLEDTELSTFAVREALPEMDNPLLSLNDVDSLAELIKQVVEIVTTLAKASGGELELPESRALSYVHLMARLIARNPYKGKHTLLASKASNSRQIRFAIDELRKENIGEEAKQRERQRLEVRLKEALAFEKHQKDMFGRDTQAFEQVVNDFFEQIAAILPPEVGGKGAGPRLPTDVLFAVRPALRIEQVPEGASMVAVKLAGPLRLRLADTDIAVMGTSRNWSLFVDGRERPISSQLTLNLGEKGLRAFYHDEYLLLEVQDEVRSLATRVAEVLLAYFVLSASEKTSLLKILATAAGTQMAEDQQTLWQALGRMRQLTARAPDKLEAISGFLLGTRRALNIDVDEERLKTLAGYLHAALTTEDEKQLAAMIERSGADKRTVVEIGDDPLNLKLPGQTITFRRYPGRSTDKEEHVVVMVPGRTVGSFDDRFVHRFDFGMLLCAKSGDELAILFFEE